MWIAVNHPECLQKYKIENIDTRIPDPYKPKAQILYNLLNEIVDIKWPMPLYAVTSHESLWFTTAKYTDDHNSHGRIITTVVNTSENRIDIWYFPPGSRRASAWREKELEYAIKTFELFSLRLFHDAGAGNPFYPYNPDMDSNTSSPQFNKGDIVEVVVGSRNKTYRTGIVSDSSWHKKHNCWVYLIKQNSKRYKKRYYAEDLKKFDDDVPEPGK